MNEITQGEYGKKKDIRTKDRTLKPSTFIKKIDKGLLRFQKKTVGIYFYKREPLIAS